MKQVQQNIVSGGPPKNPPPRPPPPAAVPASAPPPPPHNAYQYQGLVKLNGVQTHNIFYSSNTANAEYANQPAATISATAGTKSIHALRFFFTG